MAEAAEAARPSPRRTTPPFVGQRVRVRPSRASDAFTPDRFRVLARSRVLGTVESFGGGFVRVGWDDGTADDCDEVLVTDVDWERAPAGRPCQEPAAPEETAKPRRKTRRKAAP